MRGIEGPFADVYKDLIEGRVMEAEEAAIGYLDSVEGWNKAWSEDSRSTPKECPDCKRVWTEDANFCGFCGVPLVARNSGRSV